MVEIMLTIPEVFVVSSNIICPLGKSTESVFDEVINLNSAVKFHTADSLSNTDYWASKINAMEWNEINISNELTAFENLCYNSITNALKSLNHALDFTKTVLILSTTKGNISLLDLKQNIDVSLLSSAVKINNKLNLPNRPKIIAHACISGTVALMQGLKIIQSNQYENVIVVGADILSKFIISGFQSFQALANEPCKPFDKFRNGINLGEAAATIILSKHKLNNSEVKLIAGSTTNDANHISGPSRTGKELALAIERALADVKLKASDIDQISAHGTATLYNDEMEAQAFDLCRLNNTFTNSLKGAVGHTLGAAGVLESALLIEAIKRQQIIPSIGFSTLGVTATIKIAQKPTLEKINYVLKTGSGFGGCNAAIIFGKS